MTGKIKELAQLKNVSVQDCHGKFILKYWLSQRSPRPGRPKAGRGCVASEASEAVGEANWVFSWFFFWAHYYDQTEKKIVHVHKIFPLSSSIPKVRTKILFGGATENNFVHVHKIFPPSQRTIRQSF